jgi:hypothetical protein
MLANVNIAFCQALVARLASLLIAGFVLLAVQKRIFELK